MTSFTNPNGQSNRFFFFSLHEGAYLTVLTNPNDQSNRSLQFYHLVLRSTAALVVLNIVTYVYLIGLTPLMPDCCDSLKTLICLNYLFPSEGLFEAFIKCKTLFHSASLFQIKKHISDGMCRAMYDCA